MLLLLMGDKQVNFKYNSWGDSWGDSWGFSWGYVAPVEPGSKGLIMLIRRRRRM